MAYNYPYSQYQQYQPMYQQPVQQQQYQQPQQIQNNGIVSVRSYAEVENWPIAPGNSMTFLIESNPPVVCTKTRGFSQLEPPTIEAFDLVKRSAPKPSSIAQKGTEGEKAVDLSAYALKSDCEGIEKALSARIDELTRKLCEMTEDKKDA